MYFVKCLWAYRIALNLKMIMGLPRTETLSQRNGIIKCFDKINENVEVNRAPVRIRHLSRAGDSGRDTFEKENLITRKKKKN